MAKMTALAAKGEVLNPTNLGENFADKWKKSPDLRTSFLDWCDQVSEDILRLGQNMTAPAMGRHLKDRFGVTAPEDGLESVLGKLGAPSVATSHVTKKREPWGLHS